MSHRNRKTKPPHLRAEAAARLALETLVPLAELRELAGASPRGLLRWGVEGRAGIFLDVIRDPVRGWLSSAQAVRRFFAALEALKGAKPSSSLRGQETQSAQ